jgi:hypothetical protein
MPQNTLSDVIGWVKVPLAAKIFIGDIKSRYDF